MVKIYLGTGKKKKKKKKHRRHRRMIHIRVIEVDTPNIITHKKYYIRDIDIIYYKKMF